MRSENPAPLTGKWALVTGATGGIGSAIAEALAAEGANLVLHTHTKLADAQTLVQRLAAAHRSIEILQADFAVSGERQKLIDDAWNIAPLDILINNAGVDVLTGARAQLSFGEKLELLWQVDSHGTIHLSRGIGHRMKQRGTGTIINIGWDQAEHGMAGESGEMFAAIKGSVLAFSRSLAKSLAPQVRVNCVAPGWIRTKWGEQASDTWQQRAAREALVGRWGAPADVAGAIRYLVSPGAQFINGQTIAVNGGWAGHAAIDSPADP